MEKKYMQKCHLRYKIIEFLGEIDYIPNWDTEKLKIQFSRLGQRAKKVVSDSLGLVDFAIGLLNSVFNLPDGQVIFF